jgi:carboxypeptidase C (cathepsin A)
MGLAFNPGASSWESGAVKSDVRTLDVAFLLIVFAACPACGQDEQSRSGAATATPVVQQDEDQGSGQDASVTSHTIRVGGTAINYRATAGYMPVRGGSDRVVADIFYVAYERLDAASRGTGRPITFAFNGGPGSSAVWLHMGGIGPRRAPLGKDGTALPRLDTLEDNEYTWLEFTDLVFVDRWAADSAGRRQGPTRRNSTRSAKMSRSRRISSARS